MHVRRPDQQHDLPERAGAQARVHPQQQQRALPHGFHVRFRRASQLVATVRRRARALLFGRGDRVGPPGLAQHRARRANAQQVAQRAADCARSEPPGAPGHLARTPQKDTRSQNSQHPPLGEAAGVQDD